MGKDRKISDDDKALFRNSVADARRLKPEPRIQKEKKRPPPRPLQREKDEQQVLEDMFSDPVDMADVETGEELLFVRTGIQQRVMRKLRRGEFALEAELDLHGQTKLEARQAIIDFAHFCRQHNLRCVRIIHGKGHGSIGKQPVLKQYVNHWLRQRDDILAFCSARQVDGGTGAIYVLLKTGNY
ncbi:MAG: Smr/MutS family endonuclease [Gammaproteobacteria bacterium]|nr:Smr/MutS family endonuclease [Gammaproteobacteria bacterium]